MPNFSPRLAWVMLIARRPSRIRGPIYWSTALGALGDFVFRFAFFIRPLALDQLEVAIAFGGDVLRDVGVEHRGLLHQCPVLRGKLTRQAGARRDGEPQHRVGPLTVNVERLLWGRTHATLDIDPTRLIQSRSAFNVTPVNPEDALLIAGLKAFAAGADRRGGRHVRSRAARIFRGRRYLRRQGPRSPAQGRRP